MVWLAVKRKGEAHGRPKFSSVVLMPKMPDRQRPALKIFREGNGRQGGSNLLPLPRWLRGRPTRKAAANQAGRDLQITTGGGRTGPSRRVSRMRCSASRGALQRVVIDMLNERCTRCREQGASGPLVDPHPGPPTSAARTR